LEKVGIDVENQMVLGMQDLDFAQISSNLPKSNHFAQKNFAWVCGCIPNSYNTKNRLFCDFWV